MLALRFNVGFTIFDRKGFLRPQKANNSLVHVFMLPTPKQLHELLEKLKILIQKSEEQRFIADTSLEKNRIDAITKIKEIYPREVEQTYKRFIAPFLDRYAFLKKTSILTIIKKEAYEPAHTLLLAYLLQQNKSILSALIESAISLPEKEYLLQLIQRSNTYTVIPEERIVQCGKISGRIPDLQIIDEQNRWILIIENKIESHFSDGKIGKKQIDDYKIYAERKFQEYSRYYLVVSYTNATRQDALSCGWGFCNYNMVFNAIVQNARLDYIVEDYLCALVQLLCRNYNDSYTINAEQVTMKLSSIREFYEETILKLKIAL